MRIPRSRVPALAVGLLVFAGINAAVFVGPAGAKSTKAPSYSLATVGAFGGEPSIAANGSGELYDITIQALNGFNGTVNFTVAGLFPGSSQFPVPPPPVTGSGTSSFDILTQHPPNTPQGTFTITITGTSGSLSHSAQVKLQMV